jgi:hypothetical protein
MRGLKSDLWIAVLALVVATSAVWVILVSQGYSLTGVVWTSVLGLGALATVLRWGRASAVRAFRWPGRRRDGRALRPS